MEEIKNADDLNLEKKSKIDLIDKVLKLYPQHFFFLDYDPPIWVPFLKEIFEVAKQSDVNASEIQIILSEMVVFLKDKNIWERVFEKNAKLPDFLILVEKLMVAGKQDMTKLEEVKKKVDEYYYLPSYSLDPKCVKEITRMSGDIFGEADGKLNESIPWDDFLEEFEKKHARIHAKFKRVKSIKFTEANKNKLQLYLDPNKTGSVQRTQFEFFERLVEWNILGIDVPFFEDS